MTSWGFFILRTPPLRASRASLVRMILPAVQNVVHVQGVDISGFHALQCCRLARTTVSFRPGSTEHGGLLGLRPAAQELRPSSLVLASASLSSSTTMISPAFSLEVMRALESQAADLLGHVDDVIAGLGSEHDAAVRELRRAAAMVTRITGSLLAVDLHDRRRAPRRGS